MDWTQTIALGGTLIAYMTGMCIFLYRLNEKSITEWRNEHSKQKNQLMTDLTTQIKARKKSKVNTVVVTQSLLNLIDKHAARTHGFQNGLTELSKRFDRTFKTQTAIFDTNEFDTQTA